MSPILFVNPSVGVFNTGSCVKIPICYNDLLALDKMYTLLYETALLAQSS